MSSYSTQSSPANSAPKELTKADLSLLCEIFNPVAPKCFELGLRLGVEEARIKIIITNNKNDCEVQLREIISERLKQGSPLTWHDIVTALRSPTVGENSLASQIEQEYLQQPMWPDRGHYRSLSPVRGPSDRGHYRSQSPVRGPSYRGHYRSRSPVRGPSDRGHYRSRSPARAPSDRRHYKSPSPVRGPSDRWHYRSRSPARGPSDRRHYKSQSPVRRPSDRGHYRSQSPVRGPSDRGHYRSRSPVRAPSDRRHYKSPSPVRGPSDRWDYRSRSPARGPSDRRHYKSQSPVRGPSDRRHYRSRSPVKGPSGRRHYRSQSPVRVPSDRGLQSPGRGPSDKGHYRSRSQIKSPMQQFVDYLKDTYKQSRIERSLDVLKWPPTPSKVFISLACIDRKHDVSKDEADEYTRAMIRDGNIDVVLKKKESIEFADIGKNLLVTDSSERVILVEGAPGVGKSTFAWEFCRRWERREIAQQYQLVLLLRLRDERMSSATDLQDLIYHPNTGVSHAVKCELVESHGVNTLIILEGFDELPDSQRKRCSIFLQLILGHLLLHATIMITSRPWATGKIMTKIEHRIFQHMEVLGFTEKSVLKYVTSVFAGEGKKTASAKDQSVGGPDKVSEEAKKSIDDVMAYIGKYPQIKACMYIPLNAAIVVSIYQDSKKGKCILPKTLTELYYALTQILLLRYLYGHADYKEQEWNIDSFEKDLPDEVYKQLLTICKVAYDGICRKGRKRVQLIFSDSDLGGCETLGFMQSVSEVYVKHGRKMSHNFLHLTVQEFLASLFASTKSPAEQLKYFQRHVDGRLRVVLRFLAGLTKLNKVTTDQLRGLLGEPTVEQNDEHRTPYFNPIRPGVWVSPHHTNWLFEAQNNELLQSLFHNYTASFTFTREMLPLEYYSVGYCITQSHSKWSLTFDEDTEEEKVSMLLKGVHTGNIQQCRIIAVRTKKSMSSENLNLLLTSFCGCVEELYLRVMTPLSLPHLSALRILEFSLGGKSDVCDFSLPVLESLTVIGTTRNAINRNTRKSLCKLLLSSRSIVHFRLKSQVSDQIMKEIVRGLSDNTILELKILEIESDCLFATRSLVQFITKSGALQCLKIHINTFENVDIFTKGLSDNIALPLKRLDIDCKCAFTTIATRSLVQLITRSTTLQYIRICHVAFSAQGLIELTEAIHHCPTLQEKKLEELTFCVECSDDVVNLRHMIKDHPDMLKSITEWDGVTNVHSSSIQHDEERKASTVRLGLGCSQDTSLSLVDLAINDAAVEALAQALHHTTTLENLNIDCKISFTTTATRSLVQFITRSTTLQYIRICHVTFSAQGLIELTEAIHHCPTLQEKKLEELTFRVECSDDVVNLRHMIKDHPGMLKSITEWDGVTNVHSSSIQRDEERKASIVRLGLGCSQDTSLSLVDLTISDAAVEALAQALHHTTTLENLNIDCKISFTTTATRSLVQLITRSTSLQYLKMHINILEDVDIFAKGLSNNIALPLKTLDIDCNCTFTTTATRSLVQFITRSASLQCLKIHIDTIEDVDIFARGLSDNIALPLKTLDIDCKCTFTTTATRSLVQFITRSTTLQYIRICHVTFSAQGLIELTEAIHHCPTLQEKKLEELIFRVECSDDVVNLRHMIKDHPDMLKSITEWDGVTNVHSSSIQHDKARKASIVRLGLGCSQDTSLSLVDFTISDAAVEALAQALHHTTTLENLNIDCKISFTTTATRSLVQFITRSTTLQYIRICHVTFSAQGLIELTEAIHHCSRLQEKNLEELTFRVERSEDVADLRHMIKDHPDMLKSITNWDGVTNVHSSSIQLDLERKASIVRLGLGCSQDTSLSLVGMSISDAGVEALAQAFNHTTTLDNLNINCNISLTTAATKSLVQFFERSASLQCLKIHINTLEDVDIFARGLSDNIALPLKSLDVDCKCTFTTTATRSLIQFITRSTTLQYIRICHVTFSAQGLIELTEAIHHCSRLQKKLEELTFRVECSEDIVNLRQMIKDHPGMLKSIIEWDGVTNVHSSSLQLDEERKASILWLGLGCSQDTSLSLRYMSISDTGAVALAQALHQNSTLKELYLSNNNISDGGAVALAHALHHNSNLKELNLYGNDAIGKEGTHQLVQALTVNTSITKYGLLLPSRCEEYATQCTQYNTVKDRIWFS